MPRSTSDNVACMPFCVKFFKKIPSRNIFPNPYGTTMYENTNPKLMTHAIKRRSIFNSPKTPSSGGIKIGINAMCTGIKFFEIKDIIPIKTSDKTLRNFLWCDSMDSCFMNKIIFSASQIGTPECATEAANAPKIA